MTWLETLVGEAQAQLGDRAKDVLYKRGVTDTQMDIFRLGYLNGKLPSLEGAEGFLKWSHHGKKLEDVFVLPLTNALGQIKGLQFRQVDRQQKGYMDYIAVKDEPVLFGLGQAARAMWESESVWLVEGAFDLFPIQRVHANVVATLTDRISDPFGKLLRRLVREIWLAYDMDKAGWEARQRAKETYEDDFEFHDVKLPKIRSRGSERWVKDPAELWEVWGDARLGVFLKRLKDPYPQETM